MSRIRLLVPRTTQPPPGTPLDAQNPYTLGITSIFLGDGRTPLNRISRQLLTPTGATVSQVVSQQGRAVRFADTTSYLVDGSSANIIGTRGMTVLVVTRKTDTTLRQSSIFDAGNGTAGTNTVNLTLPWSDGNVYADYGGQSGANRISYALTGAGLLKKIVFAAGSGGSRVIENGVMRASQTTALTRTDAATAVKWNRYEPAALSDLCELYLGVCWNRELSREACIALSNNPWQLFAPIAVYYDSGVAVVAGGSSNRIIGGGWGGRVISSG